MRSAYGFLLRMQKENKHFTTKDIQEQTGYSRKCARDYPRKKWKWWLEPRDGGYYCKELYWSEEIFINCHKKHVPPPMLVRPNTNSHSEEQSSSEPSSESGPETIALLNASQHEDIYA